MAALAVRLRASARRFSSLAVAGDGFTPPTAPHIDLHDTERLFAAVPTPALVRALAALQAVAIDPLVDVATAVSNNGGAIGRAAVAAGARATVYKHFCAGAAADDASSVARQLWEGRGLGCILDYSVEDADDEDACRRNLEEFLVAVKAAAQLPPTSASMCIKITALCPTKVLERASDLLRWQQRQPSFPLPWKMHSFPVLAPSSLLYLTPSMPPPLTDQEQQELQLAHQRITRICQESAESGLPLLIDAEYQSLQPAIDYLTYLAALQFNKEKPVVYSTVQAYLKDAGERLELILKAAESAGMQIGIKLVRGAYMTREAKVADSYGVASPVHSSIEETHRCYNSCASLLLEKAKQRAGAAVLATHNVESGKLAARRAQEVGIVKGEGRVQFAQLMGMADGLSLALRNASFPVSKYLPYGPVDQVISYLIRRAEENRGFLSTGGLDRELLRKELLRRLKSAFT